MQRRWFGWLMVLALCWLMPARAATAGARVLDGLAIVQADGSLRVAGETVYLYGIYLPQIERTCTTIVAAAALWRSVRAGA